MIHDRRERPPYVDIRSAALNYTPLQQIERRFIVSNSGDLPVTVRGFRLRDGTHLYPLSERTLLEQDIEVARMQLSAWETAARESLETSVRAAQPGPMIEDLRGDLARRMRGSHGT